MQIALRSFLFLFFFTFLGAKSYGQALLYLQEDQLEYSLGLPVQILEDSSNLLTFDDVRANHYQSRFKKSTSTQPNPGFNAYSYWFRFRVHNTAHQDFKWLLNIAFPGVDTLEIYQVHENGVVDKLVTGDLFPFNSRPVKYKDFLIPLNAKEKETLTIYVRYAGISTKIWNSKIVEESHFLETSIYQTVMVILGSGVILGLFIYNFLLFIGIKQQGYLYYITYLFSFWVAQTFIQGYGFQFILPEFPNFSNTFTNFMALLAFYFGSVFSRVFLSFRKISPKFNTFIQLVEVVTLIGAVIQASSYFYRPAYEWGFRVANLMVYLYLPIFILMGIIALIKKVDTARFYAMAWGFTIGGVVIATLRTNGILETNIITEYALQVGVILQASLFSFGLANKINVAERETQAAQRAKIQALKENEQMVKDQNVVLEKLVHQRTEELNANLDTVSTQKLEIEQKNRNIMASINYASRIQQSLLPLKSEFIEAFGEGQSFVLYRPKDVVSGDFYWIKEVEDRVIFAVVDCTGHGVPGALMSMMGYDLLNNAVSNEGHWQPHLILASMQQGLDLLMRHHQRDSGDGMVISICTYEPKTRKLYFSGARQPLVYVQNGELKLIKGDKISIGGYTKSSAADFQQHEILLNQPTTLYLYSDGYQDQFGGPKGRKFMANKFRQSLLAVADQKLTVQARSLEQELLYWMDEAKEKQMDDITVLGVQLGGE